MMPSARRLQLRGQLRLTPEEALIAFPFNPLAGNRLSLDKGSLGGSSIKFAAANARRTVAAPDLCAGRRSLGEEQLCRGARAQRASAMAVRGDRRSPRRGDARARRAA